MIYNFDSSQWQNPLAKSPKNQKSLFFEQNGDEKLSKSKIITFASRINEQQSKRVTKGPQSHRTLQFLSDNTISFDDQSKKFIRAKLPSIHTKVPNKSVEKLSLSPQKSGRRRQITEGPEIKCQRGQSRLSLRKLNALLSNHQIKPVLPNSNYPELTELADLSKQMQLIFKKNNVNPQKIKATAQFYSPREKKTVSSIENLIKLLKT